MVLFPNSKLNLGLNIVGKRNDGYHDLETVFFPIPFKDAIEVIADKNAQQSATGIQFSVSGLEVAGDPESNLCVKAYRLLKKDYRQIPAAKIHLHKTVPIGAGLGGGSADGAFTLMLLNKKFELGLTEDNLKQYALQLGSDCPFFVVNKPCFATGRGEHLHPTDLELGDHKLIIIYPGIHVSTAIAFANIKPKELVKSIKEVIRQPITSWREDLENDFETPVFRQYPEIKAIKEKLYTSGAVYASMTGSGSAVYGIFEKNKQTDLEFPDHYFIKKLFH